MNDDRRSRAHTRGPAPVAGHPEDDAADPFKNIGQVARDARQPASEQFGEEAPATPPEADTPEQEKPLTERATEIIDAATFAIVDNIDTLIKRAERLKQSIIDDTSQAKARITANLHHGMRIFDLSKKMNSELDELENVHRQQIRGGQS